MYFSEEIFVKNIFDWKSIETKLQKTFFCVIAFTWIHIILQFYLPHIHSTEPFTFFLNSVCHVVPSELVCASGPGSGLRCWGPETETRDRYGPFLVGEADS